MANNNKSFKSLILYLSNEELIFIKSKLEKHNNFLVNNRKNKKSLSKFVLDIVMDSFLKRETLNEDIIINELTEIKKFTKRNLQLTFKGLKEQYGIEKAKDLLNKIKNNEFNN